MPYIGPGHGRGRSAVTFYAESRSSTGVPAPFGATQTEPGANESGRAARAGSPARSLTKAHSPKRGSPHPASASADLRFIPDAPASRTTGADFARPERRRVCGRRYVDRLNRDVRARRVSTSTSTFETRLRTRSSFHVKLHRHLSQRPFGASDRSRRADDGRATETRSPPEQTCGRMRCRVKHECTTGERGRQMSHPHRSRTTQRLSAEVASWFKSSTALGSAGSTSADVLRTQ